MIGTEAKSVWPGRQAVRLSTHYYVLLLSGHTNRLYEAFRGSLIDIENTWFPLRSPLGHLQPVLNDVQVKALMYTVDHHFAHYFSQDPLGMVLAGPERMQTAFVALTAYPDVIIGQAKGDHSETSLDDLGRIVWPIVKGVMAGAGDKLERELEAATRAHNVAVGIDAVVKSVNSGVGATLLVEDGYHVTPRESSPLIDDTDNMVDIVIEQVLALRGNVIFVEDGALNKFQNIALILHV